MTQAGIHLDSHQLVAEIKQRARSLGFDLVGIAPASLSMYRDYFRQWLDDGQHGTMEYLAKRFDERADPSVYLSGARSVICVGMNYQVAGEGEAPAELLFAKAARREPLPAQGRIAKHALGLD